AAREALGRQVGGGSAGLDRGPPAVKLRPAGATAEVLQRRELLLRRGGGEHGGDEGPIGHETAGRDVLLPCERLARPPQLPRDGERATTAHLVQAAESAPRVLPGRLRLAGADLLELLPRPLR